MFGLPWPALAALLTGVGSVGLVAYLRRYRGKPGVDWFLGSLSCQAAWGLLYGVALLLPRSAADLRWALEYLQWGAVGAVVVAFLAFALAYTGRGAVVERPWFRGLLAVPPALVAGTATNGLGLHTVFWTDAELVRAAGATFVAYDFTPVAVVGVVVGLTWALAGSLLLFDTVVSYGRLYRGEAVAVGLSTLPPTVGLAVWVFGIAPRPGLNYAVLGFLPHVALDAYAFVGSNMFEFHPATRRAGERAALDDLRNPVVVLDERDRVVTLNDAAADLLGVEPAAALTESFSALLGSAVAVTDDETVRLRRDGDVRTYKLSVSTLTDAAGVHVGHTVVLSDVTEERRREQRLSVLNRALRHNLRNDMTVVRGFAETARGRIDDDDVVGMLDTAVRKADELVDLGRKARQIERIVEGPLRPERVAVAGLFDEVVGEATGRPPDDGDPRGRPVGADGGGQGVRLPETDAVVETDREVLRVVLVELVENALEHGAEPVALRVESGPPTRIRVVDAGPGIPADETDVLDADAETDLQHGTGLGLWLARWGVRRLGGDLRFETGDGTTATVELPG